MLLFASAVITTLLVGREQGSQGKPETIGPICFILLASIAFMVTLDLNRSEIGLVTVSQEPVQRLLEGMSVPP
jgi:hypothetical protein